METVTCNLCQSSEAKPVYHLTDLLLDRKDVHTNLVKCCQCGLVYQNPRPTLEEIDIHYPLEYESYNPEPENKKTSWLLDKAIQYGISKRCHVVTKHKGHGRLLDIGCATGMFLHGMRNHPGWELNGVEISAPVAEIARKKYGLDVFTGTLEKAHFPDETFDAITLWDVFEHLHDPSTSLDEIYRILKIDGVLVIRVPNLSSWDANFFGPSWAGLDSPRHLYIFDPETLSLMLEKNGFQVQNMNCSIGGYPTFILSLRFWLISKGVSEANRRVISRVLYHPISRLLTAPFFFLSGLGLKGPLITMTGSKRITYGNDS